jgi:ribosomal protein S12 methylthiotransferase accessory factor
MDAGPLAASLVGFKRHLRAEVAAGDGAYLFAENGVTVLKGAHVEALAALLDGTRDIATLLGAMPGGMRPAQVAGLIRRLAQAGLVALRPPVADPADSVDEHTLAYWEAIGADSAAAVAGTTQQALRLLTVGDVDVQPALAAVRAAGLTVAAEHDPAPALSVVLCDDYLNPELAEVDALHRAQCLPWLLAKPVGVKVWLGPVFQPAEPGCWHCLAVRLWGHRNAEAVAQNALGRHGPAQSPAASIPALRTAALGMIALEATKWLSGHRHPNQRQVWTFDSLELRGEPHDVRPFPQCPTCGDPELMRRQAHRPVALTSRRKASYSAGHRAQTPEQVLATYGHLVSPVTGVIKEIRRDEHGPDFFNSFRSGPNVAARVHNVRSLRANMRIENGGKGVTAVHAEASALCEAIERYSGNYCGDEERVRASYRSLGALAVHPNECQLYDPRQYEERSEWNSAHGPFQSVCDPFDDDAVIDWTPVWSLTQQRHRLLPTGMLYFGAPAEPGPHYLHADSNGNAAGSSLEDALLQGLLELIERDAVALWWYNRTAQPAVDLDAFADPWLDELRDVYAGLGREVWTLDLTSDFGVPVTAALSRRVDRDQEEILFGFGAHLDPQLALRRALTELNQMMPQLIAAEPDGRYRCDDPDMVGWLRTATLAGQPYLAPDARRAAIGPADYRYQPEADLLDDLLMLQDKVEELGMELLVLDQTRPDVGLPVVKTIVPGMRHFWARLAPGRLYDVPVRLGRLAEPTAYDQVNPIPMFL